MKFNIQRKNNVNILSLEGNLISEYDNKSLLEEIDATITNKSSKFVIDLTNLRSLNSSGLGILITILTKARKAGGDVVIANVSDAIQKLLLITKLNTVFVIAESFDDAVKKLDEHKIKMGA